jgi:hypothetical protein
VDFPKFDGENPQLWQIRCEDYFDLFDTSSHLWVKLASMQFTGLAARWLNSIKKSIRKFTWSEFCQEVLLRFGRNQHQSLIRRLYKLVQTGTVEEYVNQFAELVDQLAAYENQPDPLHYVTRFLEGLKPAVRLLVAIQLPQDLDTAYTIALVQEEVGDGITALNSSVMTTARRNPATAPVYSRPLDDRPQTRSTEMSRTTDDKIAALRNYRRAKNLCFTCGENYSREHKCQSTVQLHVVQEMVEFFQQPDNYQWDGADSVTDMELMQLADVSFTDEPPEQSIVLHCTVQGHPAVFLLDSGSNNSFVNASLAAKLTGHVPLHTPRRVKVAGGGILTCDTYIPQCEWACDKLSFTSCFKILPLKSYDGIVGMDWLSSHSPQLIDWQQKWIAFQHKGAWVCLQGNPADTFACTVIELHVVQADDSVKSVVPPEVQSILDKFASIFAEPEELPPHRAVSRSIPLIEGARPVQIRPYRLAPELKNEVEKQIAEMLQSGVIRPSASNFASPLIMVKKKDQTWRPCIDFRHLNALTVKSKYPLPVIDELLDELHGACWFSKLDLRAGYHQIRLTEGDEHKTAFHTHHDHYEFTVMAFGLTGAPATFQAEMNRTLAPVLRKFAVVFFDDILVYSNNYQEHLQHLQSILHLLQDNQWKVKISKCSFALPSIHYLGHVISASGVATDEAKNETVKEWPTPLDVKQLRSFLGLAGYYRKFVQGYGSISQPLTALLRKNVPFIWTTETELAFQSLKKALIAAPVLALPDFSDVFVVETDACDIGIGAVLMQKDHPLAFVSKALGPRSKGLSTYEKRIYGHITSSPAVESILAA